MNYSDIYKREPKYNDDCFRAGQILEFCPGYHTTKPYFVEIIYYNKDAKDGETIMITKIPNEHECIMTVGENWGYHSRRIENIYEKKDFPELLYNQKLV